MTIALRPSGAALVLFVAVLPIAAQAQTADREAMAAERAAMTKLAWMDGVWRGQAMMQTPAGERRITQTERIGPMLDGDVRVVEGKGFNADGSVGFNALGIISYDPAAEAYTMHSYAQGRAGDFPLTPTDAGYVWTIPAGPATIRYTATLTDGTWTEVGDRIVTGQAPQRFFEMRLTRMGDTAWPTAGGPGAQERKEVGGVR
ncbi:hypothetical protein DFR49_2457 [Hephaestia caeni]|uniref:DUF1579 domain-containing protein n=1 Tax=Hephaestia caeni TaxID=645617 RepID=A0A397P5Q9_9SPHN|nr:DUF1579 domain-containing protein [Hephaestia caeni]RIA44218.1 hypothetical protein DFR49_2457 [Hephaestia caeni]